jgi:hypothetical protein
MPPTTERIENLIRDLPIEIREDFEGEGLIKIRAKDLLFRVNWLPLPIGLMKAKFRTLHQTALWRPSLADDLIGPR